MVGVLERPQVEKPKSNSKNRAELKFGRQKSMGEVLRQMEDVLKRLNERTFEYDEKYGENNTDNLKLFFRDFLINAGYFGIPFFRMPLQITKTEAQDLFDKLSVESTRRPELLKIYSDILSEVKRENEEKIKELLDSEKAGLNINKELRAELDQISIKLDSDLTDQQINFLRREFPSGNYVLHTTSVEKSILILESGAILTAREVEAKLKKRWGRGGISGIAFNFNSIRVLTGDPGHFIGFMAAPESILNDDTSLIVSNEGDNTPAKYEVQLFPGNKYSELPRVPVDKTIIVVNEKDAEALKDIMAGMDVRPRAIFTYPRGKVRVESWVDPLGDHEVLDNLITGLMDKIDRNPTIAWSDLFDEDPLVEYDTYTYSKSSKHIVKNGDRLELVGKRVMDL